MKFTEANPPSYKATAGRLAILSRAIAICDGRSSLRQVVEDYFFVGRLLAMETDWSVDHGPYSEFGDLLTLRGAQYMGAGCDIPNIRGEGRTF